MIEELCEYLIRQGYGEDEANDVHFAYLKGDIEEAVKVAESWNDNEHDYRNEVRIDIMNWREEVGEDVH